MATKEQILARHGVVVTKKTRIDPLADPLAEGSPSESLKNFASPHANGAAPLHNGTAASAPEPEIATSAASSSELVSHNGAALPASAATVAGSLVMKAPSPSPTLSVAAAQQALIESQLRVQEATDWQRHWRGMVAVALEKFQRTTMQTTTPEQLIRQHLESENEQRRLRAEGKLPPRPERRLGSAVDAFAYYTRASGRSAGGGRAFNRGAFRPAMRGQVIPPKE